MTLAERTVSSVIWKVATNGLSAIILFGRSVLLARWLPIELFGIYALSFSITKLSVMLADFGMSGALLNRAPETENVDKAAAVQFTFRSFFSFIWAVFLVAGTMIFTEPRTQLRTAMLFLILTTSLMQLTSTPSLILVRRVQQRRNAIIMLLTALISTPIMLGLALRGATLWVLLAGEFISVIIHIVMYYGWRPVWRPHFAWDPKVKGYFLDFGRRNFLNAILYQVLDRIDDIWVGIFLGKTALGFYSKAYSFATYPRTLLANPVNWVVGGAYAELKYDRERLSRLFRVVNVILIRSAFYLAGLLAIIAPEFIRLLLGDKWLPMLTAFRLMLVFTLFDPIKITIAGVISLAGGKPERVMWVRMVQLAFMIFGLFILGFPFGIAGVAIAVNGMLLLGIGLLLWQARSFVDFSLTDLFGMPTLALVLGGGAFALASFVTGDSLLDWQTILLKSGVFTVPYGLVLLIGERRRFVKVVCYAREFLVSR